MRKLDALRAAVISIGWHMTGSRYPEPRPVDWDAWNRFDAAVWDVTREPIEVGL